MTGPDEAANIAEALLHLRQRRSATLPQAIFAEIGWELLLHLFVADARGERMTARQFADRSGHLLATTSRWLRYLSEEKLVVGDGDGQVDDYLTLAPLALTSIEHFMAEVALAAREEDGALRQMPRPA